MCEREGGVVSAERRRDDAVKKKPKIFLKKYVGLCAVHILFLLNFFTRLKWILIT